LLPRTGDIGVGGILLEDGMNRIEKLRQLCSFVLKIVHEESGGDEEVMIRVFNRGKKGSDITRLREKILRRVRTQIWEHHKYSSPKWDVTYSIESPGGDWKPLGYLQIAMVMGGDHSAWVKMAQAIGIANNNNKPPRIE